MRKSNVIVYDPLHSSKRKSIIYCPCFNNRGEIVFPDLLDEIDIDELKQKKYPSIQIITKGNKKVIKRIKDKFGDSGISVFVLPIEHLLELYSVFDF